PLTWTLSSTPSKTTPLPSRPPVVQAVPFNNVPPLPFALASAVVVPLPSLNPYAACASAGSGLIVKFDDTVAGSDCAFVSAIDVVRDAVYAVSCESAAEGVSVAVCVELL